MNTIQPEQGNQVKILSGPATVNRRFRFRKGAGKGLKSGNLPAGD